ncbi:hypothetical protein BDY21DRAFT_373950 [Lineolata rhizophorae]|uniref:BZIP domain-containing protein n=1 Tax=Lineolata rhizophorae TaxID=578093 RepID=A0A6A6NTD0_9PEZI|nr:hypothetical protein BDY21DRAFT_373950 [Lineolata rhizophorae]
MTQGDSNMEQSTDSRKTVAAANQAEPKPAATEKKKRVRPRTEERRAQNRRAQKTYRERQKQKIKELEEQIAARASGKEQNESLNNQPTDARPQSAPTPESAPNAENVGPAAKSHSGVAGVDVGGSDAADQPAGIEGLFDDLIASVGLDNPIPPFDAPITDPTSLAPDGGLNDYASSNLVDGVEWQSSLNGWNISLSLDGPLPIRNATPRVEDLGDLEIPPLLPELERPGNQASSSESSISTPNDSSLFLGSSSLGSRTGQPEAYRTGTLPPPSYGTSIQSNAVIYHTQSLSPTAGASPQRNYLNLSDQVWVTASLAIGETIGITPSMFFEEKPSPFFRPSLHGKPCSVVATSLAQSTAFLGIKRDLRPTASQLALMHPSYLDLLIFSGMREKSIMTLALSGFDQLDFINDMLNGGLVCWGNVAQSDRRASGVPWDRRSWEAKRWFLEKWSALVDEEMWECSRWWWAMRGEE